MNSFSRFLCLWLIIISILAPNTLAQKMPDSLTLNWNINLETTYLIAHLATPNLSQPLPPLLQQARTDFAPFKNHPAVKRAQVLMAGGLTFGRLAIYPLHFNALPEGQQIADFSPNLLKGFRLPSNDTEAQRIETLNQWWKEIKDFYQTAGVANWLEKHQSDYQQALAQLKSSLPAQNIITLHENYHRKQFSHYHILPATLMLPVGGNFGLNLTFRDGSQQIYQLISPTHHAGTSWGFAYPEHTLYMLLHEFGHAFCNPAVKPYEDQLYRYYYLFVPLEEHMRRQAYATWESVNYELLTRAVHARLLLKYFGPQAYEKHLKHEEAEGFVFIRRFAARLEDYEKQPQRYSSLEAFYPELIQEFERFTVGVKEGPQASLGLWAEPAEQGLRIRGMDRTGAGPMAGIRAGDILTTLDGQALHTTDQLEKIHQNWLGFPVGKQLHFTLLRNNQPLEIRVVKGLERQISILSLP